MRKKYGWTYLFAGLALLFLLPVVMTVLKSLRYGHSMFTLWQYVELLVTNYTVLRYFWNSVFYATAIAFVCLLVSFPLGFLFAKVKFFGREALFFVYIVVMLLPFQATLLPNYIGLRDMRLLNTPYALMLPLMFSPLAVFMFRQFISGIEDSVLEYTLLDTSSVLKLFWYVVIPQVKDAFFALGVLLFCESWNMVEQVMIFAAKNEEIWPLSVMLGNIPKDVTYAGATLYMYPVLVLFLCFKEVLSKAMEKFKW